MDTPRSNMAEIYVHRLRNNSGAPHWTHPDLRSWITSSPGPAFETFDDSLSPASSPLSSSFLTTSTSTTATTNTVSFDLAASTSTEMLPYYPEDPCDTSNPSQYSDLTQISWVLTVLAVAYLIVIVLSVSGNALVILTVWRNSHMHTVTNYYIVNLAVSDLLVSVLVMPLKLLEYVSPCSWNVFGNRLLCPIVSYILPIFVFASVITLVAISLER